MGGAIREGGLELRRIQVFGKGGKIGKLPGRCHKCSKKSTGGQLPLFKL